MDYRLFVQPGLALILAACSSSPTTPNPNPQTPSIGAAGGTVVSADGRARLEVPAGALSTTVALSVGPATGMPLDPAVVGQSAYTISPAGVTFAVPAVVRLTYQPSLRPSGTAETELRVHRLVAGAWAADPQVPQVDAAADVASASITAGGAYAVRWPAPSSPCTLADDRLFDFWLGEWTFTQTVPVASTGVNSITRDPAGCVIFENFNGGNGRSISFFSRVDQRWHQTYIDTSGSRVTMSGAFADGAMRLQDTPASRWTWQRIDATTIRYFGEALVNGVWTVGFDSRYTAR